jgi:hypothetical protein
MYMDRTHDLSLTTYLIAGGYATLKGIEGQPGRKEFIFDRDVSADVVVGFHSSEAARIIDTFRSLKRAVHSD